MTSVTEPAAEHTIDIHTTAGKLADLRKRAEEAQHPVGEAAVDKVHAKGKLTARERILALLDEGSFVELDALAKHRSTNFGLQDNRPVGDGVVTGYGTIDGREVCIFSQDATVFGGSLGEVYGEKIVKVQELAIKTGRPLIGINDGAGARIQEGVVSLGLYSRIFRNNILASGVVPQISLIMGAAAGGHVYSPALTDFVIMVDQTSQMFITGPDVIKTVTGEDVTMEELGGAHTHMAKSGTVHYVASGEQDALDYVRDLLSYLPPNNYADPPRYPAPPHPGAIEDNLTDEDLELDTLIPDSPNQPYDMHEVITRILDDDEFLEVQAGYAQNIIVGFGRVDGRAVGIVANQPTQFAGCLDINASEKAARFVRTCDCFNIPIVMLVDVPGLPAGHRPGVQRHHPPRRQAALRLRRGHRRQDHRHHPQGLRRRVLRHGLQGHGLRRERRLADGPDRGHGRLGRGRVRLPPAAQARRRKNGDDVDALRLRAAAGLRGHPGQPVHRRRARLRRRGDPAVAHPRLHRHRAAAAGAQDRAGAAEEAREHSALVRGLL